MPLVRLPRFPNRARSRAFTLIELLVVIVIIAILVAVAIPAYLSQQVKAKDAKAKQYLAYAYRDIRGGIPETNNQFPQTTSMVSWVQQSEPELTASVGNCYALGSLTPNAVVVDSSSTSGNLTLCTRSDSGNVWKLVATPTSAPSFVDATVVPLAVSGNEITDATRAAGVQGDGRAPPDSSTGVWEGTTNLVTNGGFESNTNIWGQDGFANTLTLSAIAKFGAHSLLAMDNGAGAVQVTSDDINITAGTTYTLSTWVQAPAGTSNKNFKITLRFGAFGSFNTTVTLTSAWQLVTLTATAPAGSTTVQIKPQLVGATGASDGFLLDGVQFEQKNAATPYVETNGATATRVAARVQAPAALVNATQSWIVARVRVGRDNMNQAVWYWRSGQPLIDVSLQNTGPMIETRSVTNLDRAQITGQNFVTGDMVTVVAYWTASQIAVSLNGSVFTTKTKTEGAPDLSGAPLFDIGANNTGAAVLDGDVLWFATGTGSLSNADAATINGFGNNDPKVSSFPTNTQANFVWNGVGSTGSLK